MDNLLTEKSELDLRQAFDRRNRAFREAVDAAEVINQIVREQVRIHGAERVVSWLKSRRALCDRNFFHEVLNVIGCGPLGNLRFSTRKGSLAKVLCDAAESHRGIT